MKRSDTIANLAEALAKAQAEYPQISKSHVGKVVGQGKNGPYEYTYHYADLADTVEACRPINAKHGLSVSQAPEILDGQDCLTTVLMHKSGEWQESTRRLHAAKDDPQGAGSAITYARRYDYCAVLGIVADEDDDGAAASRSQGATTRREPPKRSVDNDTGEITGDIATMPLVDLTRALEAAELSVAGNTAAKRARLAEYQAGQPTTNGHDPEHDEAVENRDERELAYAADDPERPF